MAGEERWAAVEDVGRLRDGLGVPVPPGTPDAFTEPVDDPLGRPGRAATPAPTARSPPPTSPARLGLGAAVVRHTLQRLGRPGPGARRASSGPAGSGAEWCDAEVLRRLRRRSLARLRKEVEPVEPEALGRFLPAWQHVDRRRAARPARRRRRARRSSTSSPAARCPASALEPLVLPARVRDYEPAYLDELTASGEVLWAGHGALPGTDGWVSLHLADQAPLTLPPTRADASSTVRAAPGGARRAGAGRRLVLPAALRRGRRHRRRARSPARCGTWSGPAGSATTPSPRCGR